ncbi:MAG: LytTR family DNA-binding domain-containing protein [Sphaerochaetaceae bacterium]|nr:LytTR family DNA-binding domain-containing protein [Sphaerochaetaceae bacterium]
MDIQLICDESIRESIEKKLINKGFIINDKAAFVFYEKNYSEKKYIFAKDNDYNFSMLKFEDIIYFESDDKKTYVITEDTKLEVKEKLYELEKQLLLKNFFRINKSHIVNILKIHKIIPWIDSKLILEMDNGDKLSVTRTYNDNFKKRIGL